MPNHREDVLDIEALAAGASRDLGRGIIDALRRKWEEVPGGLSYRVYTSELLKLSDRELRDFWEGVCTETTHGEAFAVRGWYHALYSDVFRNRRVLEIGSGMGIDAVHFIIHGAQWHCADIVPQNLEVIRRVVEAFGHSADGFTQIHDFKSFERIPGHFDFIYCQGSLINLPFEAARLETFHILQRLKPGGRWIELCYPKERWIREGRLPAAQWGEVTDGAGTPWMEWYDLDRITDRFRPIKIEPLLALNFHRDDFNWFDLRIREAVGDIPIVQLASLPEVASATVSLTATTVSLNNGTTMEQLPDASIRLTTAPLQWSYAANLELPSADALGFANEEVVQLEIELTLKAVCGIVGIGILDPSLSSYVVSERFLSASDGECKLRLAYPASTPCLQLMIRNGASNGEVSVVEVESVVAEARHPDWRLQHGALGWESVAERDALNLTALLQDSQDSLPSQSGPGIPVFVRAVAVERIAAELNFSELYRSAESRSARVPLEWSMQRDDAPILAYIYRNFQPERHLEFGTWEGFGAMLCAESCDAEIWTVNLPDGEHAVDGTPLYQTSDAPKELTEKGSGALMSEKGAYITDAGPFIGWRYRAGGYASRVHQILEDSRTWAGLDLPDGFFDTILIDGGHASEIVTADTESALRLVRRGGLVLWHDFCPVREALDNLQATRGVVGAVHANWRRWAPYLAKVFWIRPSYILLGVRS
jgi:predicted O-methyltransferase YrrM